jgi:hypothetical protein
VFLNYIVHVIYTQNFPLNHSIYINPHQNLLRSFKDLSIQGQTAGKDFVLYYVILLFLTLIPLGGVGTTCFHCDKDMAIVFTLAACLTSTLLELEWVQMQPGPPV